MTVATQTASAQNEAAKALVAKTAALTSRQKADQALTRLIALESGEGQEPAAEATEQSAQADQVAAESTPAATEQVAAEQVVEQPVEQVAEAAAEEVAEEGLLSGLFGAEFLALGTPVAGAAAAVGAIATVGSKNTEDGGSGEAATGGPFPVTGTPLDAAINPINAGASGAAPGGQPSGGDTGSESSGPLPSSGTPVDMITSPVNSGISTLADAGANSPAAPVVTQIPF